MKKKNIFGIILIIILTLTLISLIIFILFNKKIIKISKQDNQTEEKEELKITKEEENKMLSIADIVFNDEDNLAIEDIDNQEKINMVTKLLKKNITETTGKEIIDTYHKYFGENNEIILDNYVCPGSYNTSMSGIHQGNARYLYIYDKDNDKYIYNNDHLGHGAGVSSNIAKSYKYYVSSEIKNDKYLINVKIYFIKNPCMGDTCIGLPNDVKIYKRHSDVAEENDYIMDASINNNYCNVNKEVSSEYSKFYDCDYEKIYDNVKEELNTYTFEFTKKNNDFMFNKYYIDK